MWVSLRLILCCQSHRVAVWNDYHCACWPLPETSKNSFWGTDIFFPWSHSCWLPWCTVEQGWPGSLWSISIHEGETLLVNYIFVQRNILNQSTCGRSTGLWLKLETVAVSVHAQGFRHRINERTCTEQGNLTVQTWHSLYSNQNYIQSLFWTMLSWCHENQVITIV